MPQESLRNFYFHYGRERLAQVLEILNDGKPAPQQRIATLLGVSKSRVSEWISLWFVWHVEFKNQELADQVQLLLQFDSFSVEHAKKRMEEASHKTSILRLADERRA